MKLKTTIRNIIMTGIKLLFLITFLSFQNTKYISRNVHLTGLVVDAATLEPVKAANIYSQDKKLLGKTNNDGYYDINFEVNGNGQIEFALHIEKDQYKTFTDKERWADIPGKVSFVLYFGISKSNSDASTFSRFSQDKVDGRMNYEEALKGFGSVRAEKKFEDQLSDLKKGNENSLFKISNHFYLVSNTGWIKIGSDTDPVSLNNKKVVLANQLNSHIKRADIKGMTPVDSKDAKFLIKTK